MKLRVLMALFALGFLLPFKCLLPSAFANEGSEQKKNNQAKTFRAKKAITDVVMKQRDAWNKGDLADFLSGYSHTDSVSYVSGAAIHRGFENIEKRYEDRYGHDKSTMGNLTFSELEITELGNKHALCIGKFLVEQKEKAPVTGRFSLIFELTKEGWKITYDHSSV